jgi:hypothetical protein
LLLKEQIKVLFESQDKQMEILKSIESKLWLIFQNGLTK